MKHGIRWGHIVHYAHKAINHRTMIVPGFTAKHAMLLEQLALAQQLTTALAVPIPTLNFQMTRMLAHESEKRTFMILLALLKSLIVRADQLALLNNVMQTDE